MPNGLSTQQEVSDYIGVARSNLSRALNGDVKYLTNNFLQKFSKAFNTTICDTWLLAGEGEMLVKDSSDSPLSSLPHQKVEITDKHGSNVSSRRGESRRNGGLHTRKRNRRVPYTSIRRRIPWRIRRRKRRKSNLYPHIGGCRMWLDNLCTQCAVIVWHQNTLPTAK